MGLPLIFNRFDIYLFSGIVFFQNKHMYFWCLHGILLHVIGCAIWHSIFFKLSLFLTNKMKRI